MLLIAEVALRLARRFNFMFSLTAARQSLPLGLLKRNKQSVPIEACFVGYLFGALPGYPTRLWTYYKYLFYRCPIFCPSVYCATWNIGFFSRVVQGSWVYTRVSSQTMYLVQQYQYCIYQVYYSFYIAYPSPYWQVPDTVLYQVRNNVWKFRYI